MTPAVREKFIQSPKILLETIYVSERFMAGRKGLN